MSGEIILRKIDSESKTMNSDTKRKDVRFPAEDYDRVLKAYQRLRGIALNGPEFQPVRQTIKTMFMSNRTPEQIIACMEDLSICDQEWKSEWTIQTVMKRMPIFLSGRASSVFVVGNTAVTANSRFSDSVSSDIKEVIEAFKPINPSHYLLYGSQIDIRAAERMIKAHGKDVVVSMIKQLPTILPGLPSYPMIYINGPADLEGKLAIVLQKMVQEPEKKKGLVFDGYPTEEEIKKEEEKKRLWEKQCEERRIKEKAKKEAEEAQEKAEEEKARANGTLKKYRQEKKIARIKEDQRLTILIHKDGSEAEILDFLRARRKELDERGEKYNGFYVFTSFPEFDPIKNKYKCGKERCTNIQLPYSAEMEDELIKRKAVVL